MFSACEISTNVPNESIKIVVNKLNQLVIETNGKFDVILDGKMVFKKLNISKLFADLQSIKTFDNLIDEDKHDKFLENLLTLKDFNIKDKCNDNLLQWSTYLNLNEISNYLIEEGCNIHDKDRLGNTPIQYAVKHNDVQLISKLIELGADVNTVNKEKYTPIQRACAFGNVEIVKLLIDSNANLNMKESNGYTPLIRACLNEKEEVVRLLIENGVEYEKLDFACLNISDNIRNILKSSFPENLMEAIQVGNIAKVRTCTEQITTEHILAAKDNQEMLGILLCK